jgi:hypothetical protein
VPRAAIITSSLYQCRNLKIFATLRKDSDIHTIPGIHSGLKKNTPGSS